MFTWHILSPFHGGCSSCDSVISGVDRLCVSPDRKRVMMMKFHETVMALFSFISTYFSFPYISVTFACKCFVWIAVDSTVMQTT